MPGIVANRQYNVNFDVGFSIAKLAQPVNRELYAN